MLKYSSNQKITEKFFIPIQIKTFDTGNLFIAKKDEKVCEKKCTKIFYLL